MFYKVYKITVDNKNQMKIYNQLKVQILTYVKILLINSMKI